MFCTTALISIFFLSVLVEIYISRIFSEVLSFVIVVVVVVLFVVVVVVFVLLKRVSVTKLRIFSWQKNYFKSEYLPKIIIAKFNTGERDRQRSLSRSHFLLSLKYYQLGVAKIRKQIKGFLCSFFS